MNEAEKPSKNKGKVRKMPRSPGRPKGVPNKTTTLLKEAALRAAELAGQQAAGVKEGEGLVEYLKIQAIENPSPFMGLLGKVLPLQVTGDNGGAIETVTRIVIETASTLKAYDGTDENGAH